eukprot:CAMPEP_0178388272 /NCGR_PEP_ID=MMETSP0689_2-20121128/9504_1 /TAXON_ID=160604 /ORGANISM="Amphidinium massartii, Strain CS-259" /LENGTH=221 /DNA_ID=CAMNT_0020008663 /DNA_START=109 /DNA_END=774 /DNA_ORIENTATION=-
MLLLLTGLLFSSDFFPSFAVPSTSARNAPLSRLPQRPVRPSGWEPQHTEFLLTVRKSSDAAEVEPAEETPRKSLFQSLRAKLKPPSKEELKKLGPGFTLSYVFASAVNMCIMIAVSWALFIKTRGGSPLLLSPLKFNPAYLAYLSVVYFSYGSVMTPIQIVLAVGMTPACDVVLSALERRFSCSRSMAVGIFTVLGFLSFPVSLCGTILLACAVARVPVWL